MYREAAKNTPNRVLVLYNYNTNSIYLQSILQQYARTSLLH